MAEGREGNGKRIGGGIKLAAFAVVLAVVFALATIAGGAIDPDAVSGEAAGSHSEEDEMATMSEDQHGEQGAAGAPAGLAISEDGYRLAVDDDTFTAGERRELRFRIVGPDGIVTDFEKEYTKQLHLVVVRRDLTGFQHLHPEMDAAGTWSVPLELPEGGVYRAYADFHTGEHELTLGVDLMSRGGFEPVALPAPSDTATSGGYSVDIEGAGDGMFDFTVSRDGEPVTDLQPYLGARGHLVAIRDGDLAYLHVHPEDSEPGDPTIGFGAELPTAGSYRLFLQFRHDGAVHTVAFTEEVGG